MTVNLIPAEGYVIVTIPKEEESNGLILTKKETPTQGIIKSTSSNSKYGDREKLEVVWKSKSEIYKTRNEGEYLLNEEDIIGWYETN